MAITWKTKITPISIPDRTVSVSATRTDDITGKSRTFTVPKGKDRNAGTEACRDGWLRQRAAG